VQRVIRPVRARHRACLAGSTPRVLDPPERSPDERYRTSPLRGLWSHQTGGFYHDGRFATLDAVVDHYNTVFGLGLGDTDTADLVEYLKSL
jgi:cytochrome c peroxidase